MCVYSAYHTLPVHISGILIQSSVYLFVKMEKVEGDSGGREFANKIT